MEMSLRASFVIVAAALAASAFSQAQDVVKADANATKWIVIDRRAQEPFQNKLDGAVKKQFLLIPQYSLKFKYQPDLGNLVGQWQGWTGSSSNLSAMQRCTAVISKAVDGELSMSVTRQSLGMTVSRRQGDSGSANLTLSPSSNLMVKLSFNGRTETVLFHLTRTGNVYYLSGNWSSGLEFHLWHSPNGVGMIPATWR